MHMVKMGDKSFKRGVPSSSLFPGRVPSPPWPTSALMAVAPSRTLSRNCLNERVWPESALMWSMQPGL